MHCALTFIFLARGAYHMSHPSHGGKAPVKRARHTLQDEEGDDDEEKDPLTICNEKVRQQTEQLHKQRRRQLTLAVHKFNKLFKTKIVSSDWFDKVVKMLRAIRNHMDGTGITVMYRDDLLAFRRNALPEQASRNLFAYDMRYGQRKKDTDTLHTVSVYGELVFKNDVMMMSEEPFQYMVSDNDLGIAIFVDGEEWENPDAFETLLTFIVGCSGKRGNQDGTVAEEDVTNFTDTQLTFMRNVFLESLSHYFRGLVQQLNNTMYPANSFPSPEFIVRCIEECKHF